MRLSIATKIFIAFAGIMVLFTSVLMFGAYRTQALHSQIRALNHRIVPLSLMLSDVQTDLKSFHVVLNERDPLVLRRTLQFTRLVFSVPERFDDRINKAVAMAAPPTHDETSDELFGIEQEYMLSIYESLTALSAQTQQFSARALEFSDLVLNERNPDTLLAAQNIEKEQNRLRDDARELDAKITSLRNDLRVFTELALRRANDNERSSLYALVVISSLALTIGIVLLIVVILTIRPLTALTAAAKRIGQGDYRPINSLQKRSLGTDEIALLTREFNAMAANLKDRDEHIHTQHAALLRSERLAAIGRMTSLVTHELRNPLSSINLNAEMLLDSLLEHGVGSDDPEIMPLLETIISEVDRLRDITEEYLAYGRLPAPKFERENICDIVQSLIDFHAWEWSNLQVETELYLETSEIMVNIDTNQIRQALLNIMKNAVEAGPPNSVVSVTIRREQNMAHIEIKDAGPGIAPESREHVFEPFFTTKGKGTGLGLPLTQQIIEQHQGHINITSPPEPATGTIFIIELPIASNHFDQEQICVS